MFLSHKIYGKMNGVVQDDTPHVTEIDGLSGLIEVSVEKELANETGTHHLRACTTCSRNVPGPVTYIFLYTHLWRPK